MEEEDYSRGTLMKEHQVYTGELRDAAQKNSTPFAILILTYINVKWHCLGSRIHDGGRGGANK